MFRFEPSTFTLVGILSNSSYLSALNSYPQNGTIQIKLLFLQRLDCSTTQEDANNTERYVLGKLSASCFHHPFGTDIIPTKLWRYRAGNIGPGVCVTYTVVNGESVITEQLPTHSLALSATVVPGKNKTKKHTNESRVDAGNLLQKREGAF